MQCCTFAFIIFLSFLFFLQYWGTARAKSKYLKNNQSKKHWSLAQIVELLPSKYEVLILTTQYCLKH
jgi:hypothetical protein